VWGVGAGNVRVAGDERSVRRLCTWWRTGRLRTLSAMEPQLQRVVAAVIRRGDTLLVCRRPAHKRHGGLWEFPGGKCEIGEDDSAAIARELAEELAVMVTRVGETLLVEQDANSDFVIAFVDVEIEGDPQCLEHDALAWMRRDELGRVALAPSDERFVASLGVST
jgi:8-oxo-dGTP diphosphatase